MSKENLENIIRWRNTLASDETWDLLTGAIKSSRKANSVGEGQLDLFGAGLEVKKEYPKIEIQQGHVNLMEIVEKETELLGVPVLYNPIDDYDMYRDLFCTHSVTDLLEMTEPTHNIVILDRVTQIDYRVSQRGNNYCKFYISSLPGDTYIYLWGAAYRGLIPKLFRNGIYLFQLEYKVATPEFSKDSIVCHLLKHVDDVDIEAEYDRLIKNSTVSSLDEPWMLKNRNNGFK